MPDHPDKKNSQDKTFHRVTVKPTVEDVTRWYQKLSSLYSARNDEYSILRKAFDGTFASNAQGQALASGPLNDKRRLAYNLVNTSTRRFMDEMSSTIRPQAIPRGVDDFDRDLAEKRTKALTRLTTEEDVQLKVIQAAYHQSLLDKAIWHVRPAPHKEMLVDISLITPEQYYPLPVTSNWSNRKAVIYSWKKFDVDTSDINTDPLGRILPADERFSVKDRVVEYWDGTWMLRLEDGVFTVDIQHEVGDILFAEAHNIPIPDRQRGQGDSDQIIGANEYLNDIYSNQADVLDYLANPIVIVRGSNVGESNLVWGPRAIWQMERDASVELLTWAGAPPTFEAQLLRTMQNIEDSTGISSPAFGRDIPSGVSGETVRSVLAGFNTRVGAKQQLMGLALAKMYKMVQRVWETQFPNEKILIPGEGTGEEGTFVMPKDFKKFYDTRVIFEPQNETVRVFTEVQKMKEDLQSKYTTMKNLGIINPQDEMNRIVKEKEKAIELQMKLNAAQGGATGFALGPDGRPLPGEQGEQPFNDAPGGPRAEAFGRSDPGNLEGNAGEEEVRIADIFDDLQDEDFDGKISVEGELAEEGSTAGTITIRVENPVDQGRVREALGALASRVRFIDPKSPKKGPSVVVGRPGRRRR